MKVGLLTEIRLNWNDDTQRISWRVNKGVNETIPTCVMKACLPLRSVW